MTPILYHTFSRNINHFRYVQQINNIEIRVFSVPVLSTVPIEGNEEIPKLSRHKLNLWCPPDPSPLPFTGMTVTYTVPKFGKERWREETKTDCVQNITVG